MSTSNPTYYYYHEIANMNSQGILFMQESRHAEAIRCFQRGLATLLRMLDDPFCAADKVYLSNSNESSLLFQGTANNTSCQNSDQPKNQRVNECLLRSISLCNDSSSLDDDVFILYRRALHLSLECLVDFEHSHSFYSSIFSGILVYNIGLAHHIQGLAKNATSELFSALTYYKMAQNAHFLRMEYSGDERYAPALLLLASANNIGHVHASFRDFEATDAYVNEARGLLSSLVLYHAFSKDSLTDEEYQVFFLNTYFFHDASLSPAPAA